MSILFNRGKFELKKGKAKVILVDGIPKPTPTPTITPTITATPSVTPSITASQTQTPTNTQTQTKTPTPSITASQTQTPTPSITASQTQTQTQTPTPSITASQTQTPTPSITASQTQTPTPSITASQTQTQTQTPTPSITASQTQTPTNTQTQTQTPTPSITASQTQTQTPTNTQTQTQTPTPSITASQTQTQTPSPTTICDCYQYEITNYYTTAKTVYYLDCYGRTLQSVSVAGNGLQTYINCAIEGSVYTLDAECGSGQSSDCITWVRANTPCGNSCITPTPTTTQTPTTTPIPATPSNTATQTQTQTTTPTASSGCISCRQYEVTNYYTVSQTVYYVDCSGVESSQSCVGNGLQTYITCAQEGSLYVLVNECGVGETSNCVTWVASDSTCGTICPTATPTNTKTPTQTPTPSITASQTQTQTQTPTPSITASQTQTPTPSITASQTQTQTQTPTPSITASQTQTPTPSITASQTQTPTPSITASQTQTPTPSITASQTQTPTPSITASQTQTPTPSTTTTLTATPTQTPTPSITASQTQTPTPSTTTTLTATPTQTPTPSITATRTQTPTPSTTTTLTATPTQTPTPSITASQTQTPTPSTTTTLTATPTQTPTPSTTTTLTATPTQTPTPSITASPTRTPTPSTTTTLTATPTQTPTPSTTTTLTATPTQTPTNTATFTPTPTNTPLLSCASCEGTGWEPYSSTQCVRISTAAATAPAFTVSLTSIGFTDYTDFGTRFYASGFNYDGTGTILQTNTTNVVWRKTPGLLDGPLNRSGRSGTTIQNFIWYGFSACLTGITTSQTYYVGIGADNEYRLVLDGQEILNTYTPSTSGNTNTFRYWHVYPVQLDAGNHSLELYGMNDPGAGLNPHGFGMEVYNNTLSQLTAATSLSSLNIIWSSSGRTPAEIVQNNAGYYLSSGYTCNYPAVYSVCSGNCVTYEYCYAPGISPTPTRSATPTPTPSVTPTKTQTPTPSPVYFSDITSDPKASASEACSSIFFNPDPTVGNNTTFCNSTTLTNPSWGTAPTGTYYISYGGQYVQIYITNGNNTASVTSSCTICPTPTNTPTNTQTQTPTPTTPSTYNVDIVVYGPTPMTCGQNYTLAALANYNVDTNLDVEVYWNGDLGGYLYGTITIPSGNSCNSITPLNSINCLGEFFSGESVTLNPSAYGSQIYQVTGTDTSGIYPC